MEQVYLGFKLDNKIFGIAAQDILRVSQIVEITAIPQAPETVMGIINVMGEVVPVIDIRKRLAMPPREVSLNDYLIILRKDRKTVSFVVDAIMGLVPAFSENDVPLKNIIEDTSLIERVLKFNNDFILIIDTQKLLSKDESQKVQKLIETQHEPTIYTAIRKATA